MSAERDSQRGSTFIYSNLYQIYRQGKLDEMKRQALQAHEEPLTKGLVLKTGETAPAMSEAPQELTSENEESLKQWMRGNSEHTKTLSSDLRQLKDARKRLLFLMGELDQLLQREEE